MGKLDVEGSGRRRASEGPLQIEVVGLALGLVIHDCVSQLDWKLTEDAILLLLAEYLNRIVSLGTTSGRRP